MKTEEIKVGQYYGIYQEGIVEAKCMYIQDGKYYFKFGRMISTIRATEAIHEVNLNDIRFKVPTPIKDFIVKHINLVYNGIISKLREVKRNG